MSHTQTIKETNEIKPKSETTHPSINYKEMYFILKEENEKLKNENTKMKSEFNLYANTTIEKWKDLEFLTIQYEKVKKENQNLLSKITQLQGNSNEISCGFGCGNTGQPQDKVSKFLNKTKSRNYAWEHVQAFCIVNGNGIATCNEMAAREQKVTRWIENIDEMWLRIKKKKEKWANLETNATLEITN